MRPVTVAVAAATSVVWRQRQCRRTAAPGPCLSPCQRWVRWYSRCRLHRENTQTMRTTARRIKPGSIHRLGSQVEEGGVNFALYSAHAERVELCLYTPDGRHEMERLT